MNIFVLHDDPRIAAEMHCDKHVPKMVLELAQMLTTAHHVHESDQWRGMYKQAHLNHPCTKWVRENSANYKWAASHYGALAQEYKRRFNKHHKSWVTQNTHLIVAPFNIKQSTYCTPFAQAMPDEDKHEDAVTAYRTYYLRDKQRFAKWEKGVDAPDWWVQDVG